ncbi:MULTISPECIES: hypothetical protein [unclassified Methanosarcina]|uniref:hypothetical protein n=1 Tax=unclassified Methanosarcina TaxID=2644672 RepID=UPI0006160841|nr:MULTISPECIES: hypothetical protein [unclassified Methanosarcina]AKB19396.1 hypothetical protein MSWHS_2533 [Methanosarcina sp. WWM596]AKB22783.1 hypothetical protein MSWH1_2512 [Methanosarcina sp. WH1]
MDLAIRIESYKNFAITSPEKPYLPESTCIRVTVAEKIASEDRKVTGIKWGIKSWPRKNIYVKLNKKRLRKKDSGTGQKGNLI